MKIEKFMQRRVVSVKPLDSIQHARELMATHRINQLPVVVDGRLVGIVTDRDVREALPSVFEHPVESKIAVPPVADPRRIPVELVMTPNVLTLGPTASVSEAAQLMRKERVGALPIIDDSGHVAGILTRSDLLDAFVALAEKPPR